MKENLKKYAAEFIGAFFLLFVISTIIFYNSTPLALALAVGFVIMVMVYSTGHISGGHFNPAVSLAAALRGALSKKQYIPYAFFQILGALLAVFCVIKIHGAAFSAQSVGFPIIAMGVCEFLFTFLLCYTVLFSATSSKATPNSYFGFAIGASLVVGIIVSGGTLCYGAFNPAVAVGLWALGVMGLKSALISIGAQVLGAIAAACAFRMIENDKIEA